LLKPGVDYKKTFTDFALKLMRRRNMQSDSKEEQDKYIGELCLSKKTLKDLLLEMGIMMKPTELLTLVDAFDANGDGVITMQEFLDFTGPKRDRKGGTSLLLNQRCSWLTTCKVTGMANGYAVSALNPRARLNAWADEKGSKVDDSKAGDGGDPNAEQFEGITGKVIIRTLKNGEKRMCAEMAERKKREDLLRKFDLLRDSEIDMDDKKGNDDEEKNDYEDDYEDDEAHGDKDKAADSKNDKEACPFIRWTEEDRKQGVARLMELTAVARQEAWIAGKMASGTPPSKPNLEVDDAHEVMAKDDHFDPTTELQLNWSPGSKEDLVSFFLLEFAGPTGGLLRSESYQECCRDPSSAAPNATFDCSFRQSGLAPGVTYAFRMRAYNGYGPGQFVYKTFTTLTAPPPKPRVMKITYDSVTLRWLFSKKFAERMADLKKLFFNSDSDGNGTLSREELIRAVEDADEGLQDFLNGIAKKLKLEDWGLLFDKIEGDEDGTLSWDEFEQFFLSSGWGDEESTVRQSSQVNMRSSTASMSGTGSVNVVSKVTYQIERCVSDKQGAEPVFETVQETNNGSALIARLEPGTSYKFRVVGVNAEGKPGVASEW
jgi:Ca2+-binding EF-hand superfamily protein